MQVVRVSLENCYGIGVLECDFDFAQGNTHCVYAPNGFMKTSFAKALTDLSNDKASKDEMFPGRPTVRTLQDEDGVALRSEQVLVVHSYEASYQAGEASLLLVNTNLKERYDTALGTVLGYKSALLLALKGHLKLKSRALTPELELCNAFEVPNVLDALDQMLTAADNADSALIDVKYEIVFDTKVRQFLDEVGAVEEIEAYVSQFDRLVSSSQILTKEFSHTQANLVQRSLADANFFKAKHWVTFRDGEAVTEVRTAEDFASRVGQEFQRVMSDPLLRSTFDALDKKLSANKELRALRDYLRERPTLVLHLADLQNFKRAVWGAILAKELGPLRDLATRYRDSQRTIREVVLAAQGQETIWKEVVDQFNSRFEVPFRLAVTNQADVILKRDLPHVSFLFNDEENETEVPNRDTLLKVLSQGEKRAFYLLNVMFEVRIRQGLGRTTLVVADDIADSFDYRNKYAIVEYLREIAESPDFRLILMTHNFDFFRSASSRIGVPRVNRRLAVRTGRRVELVAEKYQNNPFNTWMRRLSDPRNFIAAIPFVRNLAEYCRHDDASATLTEALHVKDRTRDLRFSDIDREFRLVIRGYTPPLNPPRTAILLPAIYTEADAIAAQQGQLPELESKIVLSIAIRLKAEEYMLERIADPEFASSITANQTHALVTKYRSLFAGYRQQLRVLSQVQLMTPENIHLNSFMYEPILDLGVMHLVKLYGDVKALS